MPTYVMSVLEAALEATTVQQLVAPTTLQHTALQQARPHLYQLCTLLMELPDATVNDKPLSDASLAVLSQEKELWVAFKLRKFDYVSDFVLKGYTIPAPVEALLQMLQTMQRRCAELLDEGQVMRVRVTARVCAVSEVHEWFNVYTGFDGTSPVIWWDHDMMPDTDCSTQIVELGQVDVLETGGAVEVAWQSAAECAAVCPSLRVGRDSMLVDGAGSPVEFRVSWEWDLDCDPLTFSIHMQLPVTWEGLVAALSEKLRMHGDIALTASHATKLTCELTLRHSARNFRVYKLWLK